MKQFFFTVFIAFISASTFAQKLEKPKIDKMTGDTTLYTSEEWLFRKLGWTGPGQILYTYAAKTKGSKYLVFHINITNGDHHNVFGVSKGAKAYLKVSDGSIIELTSATSEVTDINFFSGTSMTRGGNRMDAFPMFKITKELSDQLRTASITMVRIETTQGNLDFDVSDKKNSVISKELSLL
jgi:hypothetical protein